MIITILSIFVIKHLLGNKIFRLVLIIKMQLLSGSVIVVSHNIRFQIDIQSIAILDACIYFKMVTIVQTSAHL